MFRIRFISPDGARILCATPRLRLIAIVLTAIGLSVFLLPERVSAQTRSVNRAKRILVISLDGLDTRYLHKREQYNLRIPTLRRLMSEGVTARGVTSVFPSVTYPNHTTLMTAAAPAAHGIFGNNLFVPPTARGRSDAHWFARDIKTDTLWAAARRKNLTTGMVSWPVAGGVGDWNVPEIWQPGGTLEETRRAIARNARPQGLVEEVVRAVPEIYRNTNEDEGDDARTRFAEYIIAEKRPDVMLVHLFDLDHFQHDFGPFTPEAFAMLEKTDGYVARLLAAAERAGTLNETAVFITSDHGFLPVTKQVHPGVLLARAGLVSAREEKDAEGRTRGVVTKWRAAVYVTGGACAIVLRDPNDRDALNRLRRVLNLESNEGILRVLDRKAIRSVDSNTRAAFMLEAADGYFFGGNYTGALITDTKSRGMHGYLPTRTDYHASFIASGAGVRRGGQLEVIRMSDAGATIARSLRLMLRDASGRALPLD